jgi:hypothetical protein
MEILNLLVATLVNFYYCVLRNYWSPFFVLHLQCASLRTCLCLLLNTVCARGKYFFCDFFFEMNAYAESEGSFGFNDHDAFNAKSDNSGGGGAAKNNDHARENFKDFEFDFNLEGDGGAPRTHSYSTRQASRENAGEIGAVGTGKKGTREPPPRSVPLMNAMRRENSRDEKARAYKHKRAQILYESIQKDDEQRMQMALDATSSISGEMRGKHNEFTNQIVQETLADAQHAAAAKLQSAREESDVLSSCDEDLCVLEHTLQRLRGEEIDPQKLMAAFRSDIFEEDNNDCGGGDAKRFHFSPKKNVNVKNNFSSTAVPRDLSYIKFVADGSEGTEDDESLLSGDEKSNAALENDEPERKKRKASTQRARSDNGQSAASESSVEFGEDVSENRNAALLPRHSKKRKSSHGSAQMHAGSNAKKFSSAASHTESSSAHPSPSERAQRLQKRRERAQHLQYQIRMERVRRGNPAPDCVKCRWGQIANLRVNSDDMQRLFEMMESDLGRYDFREVAKRVHRYYKYQIYLPCISSGIDMPMWRTRDIYDHLTTHDNEPRLQLFRHVRKTSDLLGYLYNNVVQEDEISKRPIIDTKMVKAYNETMTTFLRLQHAQPSKMLFYDERAKFDFAAAVRQTTTSSASNNAIAARVGHFERLPTKNIKLLKQ